MIIKIRLIYGKWQLSQIHMRLFLVITYCLLCFAYQVIHCISFEKTQMYQFFRFYTCIYFDEKKNFPEEVFLENYIYSVLERIDSWIQKYFIIPLCADRLCYSLIESHLISCGFYKVVLDSNSHLILLYYIQISPEKGNNSSPGIYLYFSTE